MMTKRNKCINFDGTAINDINININTHTHTPGDIITLLLVYRRRLHPPRRNRNKTKEQRK